MTVRVNHRNSPQTLITVLTNDREEFVRKWCTLDVLIIHGLSVDWGIHGRHKRVTCFFISRSNQVNNTRTMAELHGCLATSTCSLLARLCFSRSFRLSAFLRAPVFFFGIVDVRTGALRHNCRNREHDERLENLKVHWFMKHTICTHTQLWHQVYLILQPLCVC